ncbi:MAG: hypothetical protein RLZZ445_3096, partial [Pseudomonadota bacterium]
LGTPLIRGMDSPLFISSLALEQDIERFWMLNIEINQFRLMHATGAAPPR